MRSLRSVSIHIHPEGRMKLDCNQKPLPSSRCFNPHPPRRADETWTFPSGWSTTIWFQSTSTPKGG